MKIISSTLLNRLSLCLSFLGLAIGPGLTAAEPVVITSPVTLSPTDLSYDGLDVIISGEGYLTVQGEHVFGAVYFSNALGGAIMGPRLRVSSLRVGEGSRVLVESNCALQVTGLLSLEHGGILEVRPGLAWNGSRWTVVPPSLRAAAVAVDATSRLQADGTGYPAAAAVSYGRGAGASGSVAGGGGHGGSGGTAGPSGAGGVIYDSSAHPADGGSEGGTTPAGLGGNGGGLIDLTVSNTLSLDGVISANGAPAPAAGGGGGAGGGIYVTTRGLAGSGWFEANGGNGNGDGGGGGGGRIAVRYEAALGAGFSGYSNSVAGAGAGGQAGTRGTVGFFSPNLEVYQYFVTDQGTALTAAEVHPGGTLLLGSDTHISTVTLDEGGHLGTFPGASNTLIWRLIVGESISSLYPPRVAGGADLWLLNLTVMGGNQLFVGAGTHLHVLEGLRVDGDLVAEGYDPFLGSGSAWGGPGVWITASNAVVNGRITADSQGYRQGYDDYGHGPGAHGLIGGGAHGGQGSDGGQTYGSPTQPIQFGSSGGGKYVDGWRAGTGGAGGGAIRLEVLDTLTLNGWISADGGAGLYSETDPYKDGGGAGGSVWVEADKLVGAGGFSAVGGPGSVNCGGGGRIAVYYRDGAGFSGWTNATVRGGGAWLVRGYVGTLGFFDTSGGTNHYKLFVPQDRFSYDLNPFVDTMPPFTNVALGGITVGLPGVLPLDPPVGTPAWTNGVVELTQVSRLTVDGSIAMQLGVLQTAPNAAIEVGDSLLLSNGAWFRLGGGSTLEVAGTISVQDSNTTLLVQGKYVSGQVEGAWRAAGGTLRAAGVVVGPGAQISADAQGYVGGYDQYGLGPGAHDAVGGAAHGGHGSDGGQTYGSSTQPTGVGSSGGGKYVGGWYSGTGGAGGGAVRLEVLGTLSLNGRISADAGLGGGPGSFGGGAGGSVWVQTGLLEGNGSFSAMGGDGGGSGGAGGGGRIAVYYRDGTGFAGYTPSSVAAGAMPAPGQAGTMGFFETSGGVNQYRLFVPRDRFAYPPESDLNLAAITVGAPGTNSVLLELGTGSTLDLQDLTLTSGWVQFGQDSLNRVRGNLALSGGATLAVGGGALLEVGGTLSLVDSNSMVLAQAKNVSGQVDGQWQASGITIQASNVIVNAGTRISADAQGYPGAYNAYGLGPGAAGAVGGGSHGGAGAGGGPTYDSSLAPIQPGSSGGGAYVGGWYSGTGGSGGGAVHLVVSNQLTLEGQISADAGPGGGPGAFGGGAGGAVWVQTAVLSGAGQFSARGSDGGGQNGGGGGGRIAVYYTNASGFTSLASSSVMAGSSGSQWAGQAGTLVFADTSLGPDRVQWLVPGYRFMFPSNTVTSGSLTLGLAGGTKVVWDLPADSFLRLADNLTIREGAVVNVGGGSTIEVGGTCSLLGSNSVLLAQGKNTYSQVAGQWAGAGLTLIASNLTIGRGATLNADGQGYQGGWNYVGSGPGAGAWWYGGSYGGHGGGGNPTYGSSEFPVDLGSAGGGSYDSWYCNAAWGGTGGGAVHLVVRGTTSVEGSVSANGTDGHMGYGGGGSGGSIWIETGTLTGSGLITANGGNGSSGGGGGRIAVYGRQLAGFEVAQIQVSPGGGAGGETGTLVFSDLVALQVASLSPSGVQKQAFDHLDVMFSSAVVAGTLTLEDLAFTTPGGAIPASQLTLAWVGGTTYRIGCPLQWARGGYSLQVGPQISSVFGLAMTNAYAGAFAIEWPCVAGAIRTPEGWPVGGVVILTNGVPVQTTGANGRYAVLVPFGWSGEVSASLSGATFDPAGQTYSNVVADAPAQDITLTSGHIPSFSLLRKTGTARFEWSSLMGLFYQLQSSTNLVAWEDCGAALPGTGGPLGFTPDPRGTAYLFYRLRLHGP